MKPVNVDNRGSENARACAIERALSIRQPWAWAILHAGKRVENRSWKPPRSMVGQRFYLHASATRAGEADARRYIERLGRSVPEQLPRGGIVGVATLVGLLEPGANDPWYMGQFGWVLDDVEELSFVPMRGALGFFRVPEVCDG